MTKFLRICLLSLIVSASVFIPVQNSKAADTDRSHIIVTKERSGWFRNIHGGSVVSAVPDLTSYWSSTNNDRFILKTMWVNINGDENSWIENGYFEGADVSGNYWDGFYMAYGIYNPDNDTLTYTERKVSGPSKAIGTNHTHQIVYLGDSVVYWRSTIDSSYSWDVYGWAGDGSMDVGIEVNNSSSTLNHSSSNKTPVSSLKWYEDGSWHDWDSGSEIIISDYFNTGIKVEWTNPNSYTSARWWK